MAEQCWDGIERRKDEPGRRSEDRGVCAMHHSIQNGTKQSRSEVCDKIKTINMGIDKMVSWKIFAFLFTFSVLVVGSGFGFFGSKLEKISDKQEVYMDSLQSTIAGIATTQAVMMSKFIDIEKRQDILRDQNIKMMQK